jgi:hypothetical protein
MEKFYEDEGRVIYTGREHVIVLNRKNYTVQIWHIVIHCTVIEAHTVCHTRYFMIEEKLNDIITWKRTEEERLNEAIGLIEENGTDRMARAWRPAHAFMKWLEKEDIDKLYETDKILYDAISYTEDKVWDGV